VVVIFVRMVGPEVVEVAVVRMMWSEVDVDLHTAVFMAIGTTVVEVRLEEPVADTPDVVASGEQERLGLSRVEDPGNEAADSGSPKALSDGSGGDLGT